MTTPGKLTPPVVGGPADDTSVRDLLVRIMELKDQVLGGSWLDAIRTGGTILSVFADLFSLPPVFGAAGEACETELNACGKELEACRKELCKPAVSGAGPADPKKLDPATLLLIIQLITSLIEAWRKRRNPPNPTP